MRVSFTFDTSTLPAHTKEELKEWIAYRLGNSHSMSSNNPLGDYDLEATNVRVEV